MAVCLRCGLSYSPAIEFCGLDGERLVHQEQDPLIGRTVDRYLIDGFLGAGAMARVYRARHTFLESEYAIKILHGEIASNRNLAERFRREALAAGKIKHPNVATMVDFGVTSEGVSFAVMELIHGASLAQRLAERGAFSPHRAAEIALDIASGLAAAHALGFVHRDLKPGNVMLARSSERGREVAKVVDFGLVRLGPESEEGSRLTQTGQVFGTPMYMAPEQVAGGHAGPTADLYALGIIIYELLTGRPPFTGGLHLVLARQLSERPRPLDAFGGLGPLAMTLLEKEPEDRPQRASDVCVQLETLVMGRFGRRSSAPPKESPRPVEGADSSPFLEPAPTIPSGGPSAVEEAPPAPSGLAAAISGRLARVQQARVWWIGATAALASLGVLAALWADFSRQEPSPEAAPLIDAEAAAVEDGSEDADEAQAPASTGSRRKKAARRSARDRKRELDRIRERERRAEAPPPAKAEANKAEAAFGELDRELRSALDQRGLLLQDLEGIDAAAVDRWRAWRVTGSAPVGAPVGATFERLRSAARVIYLDTALLSKKLDRVLAGLKRAAGHGADVRAAEARYQQLREAIAAKRAPAEMARLAGQITALEIEVARRR